MKNTHTIASSNKTTIDIKGMHCKSCEILIEDELTKVPGVIKCTVSHKKAKADIYHTGRFNQEQVNAAVEAAGYSLGTEERFFFSKNIKDYQHLGFAVFAVAVLFVIGKALGIFDIGSSFGNNFNSLPLVFLIGLTAGISTCMAIVGGLVLGASARFAEKHPEATPIQKFKPHIFFNLGRIASYVTLGGLIGYLGSFLQLSTSVVGLLTIIVGLVMLLLGIQLTEVVPGLNRLKITLPKQISRMLGLHKKNEKEYSHTNSFVMGMPEIAPKVTSYPEEF